jgi:hypothetical protein
MEQDSDGLDTDDINELSMELLHGEERKSIKDIL